ISSRILSGSAPYRDGSTSAPPPMISPASSFMEQGRLGVTRFALPPARQMAKRVKYQAASPPLSGPVTPIFGFPPAVNTAIHPLRYQRGWIWEWGLSAAKAHLWRT